LTLAAAAPPPLPPAGAMVAQTRRAADDMGPLRRSCRKLARDLVVMEPARPAGPERAAPEATPVQAKGLLQHIQESTADAARERAQPARKVPRLNSSTLEKLVEDFAEDYFSAPRCGSLSGGGPAVEAKILCDGASPDGGDAGAEGAGAAEGIDAAKQPQPSRDRWLGLMRLGFSLLVQGCGSKRRMLDGFATEVLLPWGASVLQVDGYNRHLSLVECLRDVLESLYPGTSPGTSVESALAALRAARAAACAQGAIRPLVFVVHSLDVMPEAQQRHVAVLATLPRAHLVASVDSIWAPLAWQAHALRDFNFVHVVAHTYEDYAVEAAARYPGGKPAWADPDSARQEAPKASVGLVLKHLTPNHRELVEVIARHQLEGGGRTGISRSKLLILTSQRMIAGTTARLATLLNELQDHEIVALKSASDGGALIYLPYDTNTVQRLSELSTTPFDDEESEEDGDAQSEQEEA